MSQNFVHSGHILGVAAVLAPLAGVFAPTLVTPVALFAMLGLLGLRALDRDVPVRSDRPLIIILGLILGWSALSLIWTFNTTDAVLKCVLVIGFGLLALATLLFRLPLVEHERHVLRRFIVGGIALSFALLLVEMATAGAISRLVLGKVPIKGATLTMFNTTATLLLMFIWPAIAILWRSMPLIAFGLIGLGFVAAYLLPSASASIGYIVGVVFFFIALLAPRGATLFFAVAVAFAILVAPFVPRIAPALDPASIRQNSNSQNASFLHRLDIWSFTIDKIKERPLLGWGFNASRTVPDGDAHYYLRNRSGDVVGQGNRLPLHPHNGALQIWLELGLPGAAGFAALFALAVTRIKRQTEVSGTAAALGAIGTATPIWLLSFGIWQTWWMSVLVLTTLLTVSTVAQERS